jgi:ribosomal silencing factor RsfS
MIADVVTNVLYNLWQKHQLLQEAIKSQNSQHVLLIDASNVVESMDIFVILDYAEHAYVSSLTKV